MHNEAIEDGGFQTEDVLVMSQKLIKRIRMESYYQLKYQIFTE